MKRILIVSILAFTGIAASGQTKWSPAAGTVSFTIKNMGSIVTGSLSSLRTNIVFSPDKLASSVLQGTVAVGTINTGNGKRDKDLQEEKYFNAAGYKLIEMRSTRLARAGGQYSGTFNITMKGVTKQMVVPFEFIQQGKNAEFKSDFTINRRDFGIGTKSGLAITMGDDVHVHVDVKVKS